jgi:sugar (pentulose or hexulose) kinase
MSGPPAAPSPSTEPAAHVAAPTARAADHVLAIDCGTQSLRALVVDPRGEIVAKVRIPFEPYVSAHPGWAEQDPEVWWRALGEACRRVLADPAVPHGAIAGVALTTQRASVVVVDADGRPLRPAITWLDQRRTDGLPPIGGVTGLAFRALGVRETVAAFQADAEVNWIRRHEPEVWARTAGYLFVSGFLTQRLVGRAVDSVGCQVGYVPFDYKRLCWSAPGDWKWRVAPVDPAMLPELVPPGGVLGEITAEAAELTGIPAGLPLIAAAADKACEVLGVGALEPSIGALSYGTTATLNTTHRRYVEAIPMVPPYPAAVAGAYSLEIQVNRGYWMVEWFKREFGDREVARAVAAGVEPEALFDELVRAVPAGSMGLTLQPYWSPGVRIPGPEAKGAIIGWGDVHTRAHLYRAILEGLTYALREGAERTEKRTGVRLRELRVSGGGSQSPAAIQLTADIFGLPTGRPHTYEASGLGAAIVAAVGLGIHPSMESAVAAMVRVTEVRDPDPETQRVYDALYRDVYLRIYPALRPLYSAIARITGYPSR